MDYNANFSIVGKVVLLQGGGPPLLNPPPKPRCRSFSMLLTLAGRHVRKRWAPSEPCGAVWQVFTFFQFVLVQGEDLNFE